MSNRLGKNRVFLPGGMTPPESTVGDFGTPEQETGRFYGDRNIYWESSMTLCQQETRLFASQSRCEKSLGRSASPREGGACRGGLERRVRKGRSRRLGGGIEKGIARHVRSMKMAAASSVAERG